MAQEVMIAGALFSNVPSIKVPDSNNVFHSFVDPSDTTATASDVAQGKYFYAADGTRTLGTKTDQGVSVVETLDSHGGTIVEITGATVQNLDPILMRPDAEKVATYTYDKYLVEDEGIDVPAYSTTAKVLKASANLSPTYTVSLGSYNYYVLIRCLTIPEYSITTLAKGRTEYSFAAACYEIATVEANTMHSLINPSHKITGRTTGVYSTGNFARILYYQSATAVTTYASAAYSVYQTVTAPAISGSTLTLKSPAFGIRGSTTYLTSTYFGAIDDIRYQYIVEVYRAPKNNLDFDGWTVTNHTDKLLDFQSDPNYKLR